MSEATKLLEGFEVVLSDNVPAITLDTHRRFYLNKSVRSLIDVRPHERLAIAYNVKAKSLAIIRPNAGISPQEEARFYTSNYNVDKRFYMTARHFSDKYRYAPEKAPYKFVYERGASDGTVFIFRLHPEA